MWHYLNSESHTHMATSTVHPMCGHIAVVDGHMKLTRSVCRNVQRCDPVGNVLQSFLRQYCPNKPAPRGNGYCKVRAGAAAWRGQQGWRGGARGLG